MNLYIALVLAVFSPTDLFLLLLSLTVLLLFPDSSIAGWHITKVWGEHKIMLCLALTELFALDPGISCLKSPVWKYNTWKEIVGTVDFKTKFQEVYRYWMNMKSKNDISRIAFGHRDSCFIVISTWPYTEKSTLLPERYLTKLSRRNRVRKVVQEQRECLAYVKPVSSSCYCLILLQYGKTLYDNYKCAVKKAGLSSRWANQKVVEPVAPAGSSSAGTDTVTFIAPFYYYQCCIESLFRKLSHGFSKMSFYWQASAAAKLSLYS